MAILIDRNSKIVIQGITGREATMVTKHTLAYGTKIVAGITPGKGGQDVEGVPVYDTLKAACREHELDTSLVYVPPAFVFDAVMEAIANGIKLILIATENVPQKDAIKFLNIAQQRGVRIVGPNSVGMISPGERVKLGAIGGDNVERCFVPGPVGVISRSGGMTAETSWMVKRAGYGVSTAISIGGDALIGSSIKDLLALFEKDPETKAVVTYSEPGTSFEEEAAEFIKSGGFTKPLISYISGRFTESMPEGTVFGHAGAMISGGTGKPSTKMAKLKEAGAYVLEKFDDMIPTLKKLLG
ncbi:MULTISPECIES: CoA-binding protein [unclassified Carboxydocella]|uniref:succinate--CoA ligase subunit alpha n=1 Tax=unclassified Carboxydocella TaxID=2685367 RepID=UPI0009AE40CF|nr:MULTISPECIES: CoA-binding protein [unclassified Carboxydocella]AVX31316.1 succinyl-CoA synthetase alpha subunit [Carboxydocella thermautotrophica]GAW29937.1 succinyl-CoA synthetase subunit alpha [Carboxydocella sp. ULO1]GAW30461.1 succinyl-CoA synthetase subunit alpha [Carboxydocella sp. JDF658]